MNPVESARSMNLAAYQGVAEALFKYSHYLREGCGSRVNPVES